MASVSFRSSEFSGLGPDHRGTLCGAVGRSCNMRSIVEQWTKEGNLALNCSSRSCHRLHGKEVRLRLSVIPQTPGELLARVCVGEQDWGLAVEECQRQPREPAKAVTRTAKGAALASHTRPRRFEVDASGRRGYVVAKRHHWNRNFRLALKIKVLGPWGGPSCLNSRESSAFWESDLF